jgi:hypothetical protein
MRRPAVPLGATAAVIAALVLPAAASATDYCVSPATGCTLAHTYPASAAGVQAALDAAGTAADADRVLLGAQRYTSPAANGFAYAHPTFPVELIGQGTGATTLAAAQLSNRALAFNSTADSVMRDLTVDVPYKTSGTFPTALYLTGATARNVAVVTDPTAPANVLGANAVELNGATFVGGSVTLPMTPTSFRAIGTTGPGNSVRDSTLTAAGPLNITADNATLSGLRVTGGTNGAVGIRAVGITLADSTIVQQGQGPAVTASNGNGVDAAITLDHDTIVGDGTASSSALYASATAGNGKSATVILRNSVVQGFTASLLRAVGAGAGPSNITTSYSDYPPTSVTIGSGGSGAFTEGAGNIDADPAFVSASGDYRLTATSPAIDAGDPAGLLGNEPGLDLAGLPRVVLGNAGCAVRSDMGAFEFQATGLCGPPPPAPPTPPAPSAPLADTTAPVLSGLAASPSRFKPARAGKPVGKRGAVLRFSLTEAAKVKVAIVRRGKGHKSGGKCRTRGTGPRCTTKKTLATLVFSGKTGVNAVDFAGRVRGRALRPGYYQLVATATDAAGNHTDHAVKARFRVKR